MKCKCRDHERACRGRDNICRGRGSAYKGRERRESSNIGTEIVLDAIRERVVESKLLDEDTKQLDEYEPEFVRNLKGLAENKYMFQLSKKRLAEAEYSIQFSETPPRRERVLDRRTLDRWTEH